MTGLVVRGLACGYATSTVLRGLDLQVGSNEIVGLLGRNGMGKTTLVRSLLGMSPPGVTAGSITWDGHELVGRPSFEVARLGVGLVPQGRRVFGSLTVRENLTVIASPRPGVEPWTVAAIFDLFPRLAERSGSMARTLSGGEQQMLAIGRALMTNPALLVMDEASEGLAPSVLESLVVRLEELRGRGLAVLLVEQNLWFARSLADRIVVLGGDGVTVWSGTPAEFDAAPGLVAAHLGV